MDVSRLIDVVKSFVDAVNGYLWDHGQKRWDDAEEHRQDAMKLVPSVQAIARKITGAPDPVDVDPDPEVGFGPVLDAALKLQGALEMARDLAEALQDDGPELSLGRFHSWVREASTSLWVGGHYRQAVHAAATIVDEHLQAKLGREDVYGTALAREAFAAGDPTEGRPRLRFSWISKSAETFRPTHDGARDFGAACSQLIRNTAAHRTEPLSEAVALEQLAALSYWARLVDTATVEWCDADVQARVQELPCTS